MERPYVSDPSSESSLRNLTIKHALSCASRSQIRRLLEDSLLYPRFACGSFLLSSGGFSSQCWRGARGRHCNVKDVRASQVHQRMQEASFHPDQDVALAFGHKEPPTITILHWLRVPHRLTTNYKTLFLGRRNTETVQPWRKPSDGQGATSNRFLEPLLETCTAVTSGGRYRQVPVLVLGSGTPGGWAHKWPCVGHV
ncbi:uncharacterized protein EI97DRAFT_175433 [Westerdykella ornata]|uniref:Uncharacterized protein n=1 Tax=Westerdykella ornata TaxID=318751 RepID=A0A6A6JS13_WESOR|nr:uncharacterized protein EI97DRAFT_175433 [Westerdykella ornata]KAF2279411.1 hypothetical protein EI97DRAFT_175433 [Westerdykella ornata]